MWAGGIAAAVALVAWSQVVGRGFVMLGAGVALTIGAGGAAAGAGGLAWAAAALALLALLVYRPAAITLTLAAVLWVMAAAAGAGVVGAVSGAVALGGVTAEMLLGHWYLVDPRLPRWALRNLALIGLAGVIADAIHVWSSAPSSSFVSPAVLVALSAVSVILLVAVIFSLKVPSYTGVMAATGLSYLAVITTLGSVVVGRAVIG